MRPIRRCSSRSSSFSPRRRFTRRSKMSYYDPSTGYCASSVRSSLPLQQRPSQLALLPANSPPASGPPPLRSLVLARKGLRRSHEEPAPRRHHRPVDLLPAPLPRRPLRHLEDPRPPRSRQRRRGKATRYGRRRRSSRGAAQEDIPQASQAFALALSLRHALPVLVPSPRHPSALLPPSAPSLPRRRMR
ncbi:hypothetical protein BJY59DRAFT_694072 [Rhodotorula toruloides]